MNCPTETCLEEKSVDLDYCESNLSGLDVPKKELGCNGIKEGCQAYWIKKQKVIKDGKKYKG